MDFDAWLAVLVPVGALVVALLAARRLVTDDPLTWPPHPLKRLRPLVVAGHLLPGATFILATWLDAERLVLWTASAATIGLGFLAADLSRLRRAARPVVAWIVTGVGFLPLIADIADRGPATLVHPSFLVLAAILPAACLTRPLAKSWLGPALTFFAAVPLVVWLAITAGPSRAPRPTEVCDWLSRFDRPVTEMIEWDTFGRAAAWLRNERGLTVDLRVPEKVMRDALQRGDDVHPTSLAGALEAGLLGADDFARLSGTELLRDARRELEGAGRVILSGHARADLLLLIASGEVASPEQRQRLIDRLAQTWPKAAKFNSLEDASVLCRLFVLLDARDRITEQREYLHQLLERTWCAEAPSFSAPGGFTPFDDDGLHPSDPEATWHALEIIRHVGATPSIDLGETGRYLRNSIRRRTPRDRLDRLQGDRQITWMRYQVEHDAAPSAARRLEEAGGLLGAAAFLVFVAYLLVRARPVRLQPPAQPKLAPWAASAEAEANKDRPL